MNEAYRRTIRLCRCAKDLAVSAQGSACPGCWLNPKQARMILNRAETYDLCRLGRKHFFQVKLKGAKAANAGYSAWPQGLAA